jgi:hypothetical protein
VSEVRGSAGAGTHCLFPLHGRKKKHLCATIPGCFFSFRGVGEDGVAVPQSPLVFSYAVLIRRVFSLTWGLTKAAQSRVGEGFQGIPVATLGATLHGVALIVVRAFQCRFTVALDQVPGGV